MSTYTSYFIYIIIVVEQLLRQREWLSILAQFIKYIAFLQFFILDQTQ